MKETSHNIKLGLFVITGLLLLIVGLYFVGSNKNMFNKTFVLTTTFQNINGLTTGNNVRYSGMNVGTVDKITLVNDSVVLVKMIIDNKYKNFIRKNSVAAIGTDGLMGNKLVNIQLGSADFPYVDEGDEILSQSAVNTESMMRTLETTNQNVALVSENLKTIMLDITAGKGNVYSLLVDTTVAGTFHSALHNIALVSGNLKTSSQQLQALFTDINSGKGTLGLLLKDSTTSNQVKAIITNIKISSEQLSSATSEANDVFKKANTGNGPVSTLVNDTAFSTDLKQSMQNIQTASEKLNENLEALKHSFLLRGYFRKQDKAKKK
jgi:phospholipid/cholesterol/gamma-HCH transport system substrate-binding protein